jgi:hypothetical protein
MCWSPEVTEQEPMTKSVTYYLPDGEKTTVKAPTTPHTATVPVLDMVGREIRVGDVVVHGGRRRTTGFLELGVVEKVEPFIQLRQQASVTVRKLKESYLTRPTSFALAKKPSVVTDHLRLLVIDSQDLPDDVRAKLYE